jgi:hypothetical protein
VFALGVIFFHLTSLCKDQEIHEIFVEEVIKDTFLDTVKYRLTAAVSCYIMIIFIIKQPYGSRLTGSSGLIAGMLNPDPVKRFKIENVVELLKSMERSGTNGVRDVASKQIRRLSVSLRSASPHASPQKVPRPVSFDSLSTNTITGLLGDGLNSRRNSRSLFNLIFKEEEQVSKHEILIADKTCKIKDESEKRAESILVNRGVVLKESEIKKQRRKVGWSSQYLQLTDYNFLYIRRKRDGDIMAKIKLGRDFVVGEHGEKKEGKMFFVRVKERQYVFHCSDEYSCSEWISYIASRAMHEPRSLPKIIHLDVLKLEVEEPPSIATTSEKTLMLPTHENYNTERDKQELLEELAHVDSIND